MYAVIMLRMAGKRPENQQMTQVTLEVDSSRKIFKQESTFNIYFWLPFVYSNFVAWPNC